jgi:hypothetical protein
MSRDDLTAALQAMGFQAQDTPLPPVMGARPWYRRKEGMNLQHLYLLDLTEPDTPPVEQAFDAFRGFVNGQCVMPRALRFTAPHMLHVLLCEGLDPELARWVRGAPRATIWGGEKNHVLALDRQGRRLVHQDIFTRIHHTERMLFDQVGFGEVLLGHLLR